MKAWMKAGAALCLAGMAAVASAQNLDEALRNAVKGGENTEGIRDLLDKGANPNAPDNIGRTAVHLAAGVPANLSVLISGGGDTNAQDSYGDSPLHYASRPVNTGSTLERERAEAIRILLQHRASPDVSNNDGDTPLHIAARHANINYPDSAVEALLGGGASPNSSNNRGDTPLHAGITRVGAVGALLDAGADASATNREGLTPLQLFARDGTNTGTQVKLLINAGADPDFKAPNGNAPLHTVILESGAYARDEAIDALLSGGGDPCVLNSRGQTPFDLAPKDLTLPASLERSREACEQKCMPGETVIGADGLERPCVTAASEPEGMAEGAAGAAIAALSPKCADLPGSYPAAGDEHAYAQCWQELGNQPGCYVYRDHYHTGDTLRGAGSCEGGVFREGRATIENDVGTAEGPYVDGKPNGRWVVRDGDGVAEGPYVDGKPNGRWVVRLPDGSTFESCYRAGELVDC